MNENEHEHACNWFVRAHTDLVSATLLTNVSGPPETICFLAQQGAQKYLKGYLVWQGVPFRKVHDLLEILNACRAMDDAFGELEADCHTLTPYSVKVQYPGYPMDCTAQDAHDALIGAEHICRFVCERLGLDR